MTGLFRHHREWITEDKEIEDDIPDNFVEQVKEATDNLVNKREFILKEKTYGTTSNCMCENIIEKYR